MQFLCMMTEQQSPKSKEEGEINESIIAVEKILTQTDIVWHEAASCRTMLQNAYRALALLYEKIVNQIVQRGRSTAQDDREIKRLKALREKLDGLDVRLVEKYRNSRR